MLKSIICSRACILWPADQLALPASCVILETRLLNTALRRCRVMYDRGSEAWSLIFSVVDVLTKYGGIKKVFQKLLWGTFCRFFRQMLIAAKVPSAVHCGRVFHML